MRCRCSRVGRDGGDLTDGVIGEFVIGLGSEAEDQSVVDLGKVGSWWWRQALCWLC
jgi:hypothetical protein